MKFTWSYDNNGNPTTGGAGRGSFNHAGHSQPNHQALFNQGGFHPAGFGQPNFNQHEDFVHTNNLAGFAPTGLNQPNSDIEQLNVDQGDFSQVPEIAMNQANVQDADFSYAPEIDMNQANDFDAAFPHAPEIDMSQPSFNHAAVAQVPEINLAATGYAHEGKTVRDMMAEENHGVYQGYIRSHEHAARLEAEYLAITAAKIAPSIRQESLADIPRTDEARAHWRARIFYAITDFGNVVNKDLGKDKEGNLVDKGTVVNTHVRRVRNLGGFANELMADKILKWAVEAHEGNPGIPPWCEKRSWHMEQFLTFNARMEAVLQALRTNKSVPHAYIQVDPTRRFVAAPQREIRVKQGNMNGNEIRGDLIDEGRQAKQKEGN
ncbi:hypothetical protein N0V85_006205 [Neurospora sp. IMI 360204]|nr:hypothetical protein N0V85_006205 [Neurospora sp. IMI 360204]